MQKGLPGSVNDFEPQIIRTRLCSADTEKEADAALLGLYRWTGRELVHIKTWLWNFF